MSDIFTEVDEDLRRERALKLWKAYGNYVIGAAILVVLGTAVFVAWRDYDRKQSEAGAAQYLAALEQARAGDAGKPVLDGVARDGRGGYAVLARLQAAAALSRAGDLAGAAASYRAVAADGNVDQEFRDAATLMAALNTLDGGNAGDIESQVASLTAPASPWRHLAWETMAVAAARAGKMEEARTLYKRIADDPEAPAALRARAAEMIAGLSG